MKAFVATLLLAAVASAAPGGHGDWAGHGAWGHGWGHGAALAGPHTGPNHLVGPSNGPSSLAGPSVGPSRLSGAVDHGAVVTGAITGPSSVKGSIDFGTHVDDHWGAGPHGGWGGPGPYGGPWGGPYGGHGHGHGGWGHHGAVLAGPHTGPTHISGPVAPGAVIKGPSGVIHAGGWH